MRRNDTGWSLGDGPLSVYLNDVVRTEPTVVETNSYGFPTRSVHTGFDAVVPSLGDEGSDRRVRDRVYQAEEHPRAQIRELLDSALTASR